MFKFLTRKKIWLSVAVFLALAVVVFGVAHFALAAAVEDKGFIMKQIGNFLGVILYIIVEGGGAIVGLVISVMVAVASFNKIVDQPAVNVGWVIIRDVCNNFFIIILLAISVGTILRVPNYHYKQLLPKLLLMAVMINFSKFFAGLLIDFSQIMMLIFTNEVVAVKNINILRVVLGIPEALNLSQLQGALEKIDTNDIVGALLVALIATVVSLVVITIITIVLLYRIVMLMFLVILSPIAFFASILPKTQSYAGRWWNELFKYLVVGPAMMFFLYISIMSMAALRVPEGSIQTVVGVTKNGGAAVGLSGLGTPTGLFNFMIAIGLMVGALMVAQEMGGVASSWGSTGLNKLKSMGKGPVKLATRGAVAAAGGTARLAGAGLKAGGLALGGASGRGLGWVDKKVFSGRVGATLAQAKKGEVQEAIKASGGGLMGTPLAAVAGSVGYMANIKKKWNAKRTQNQARMKLGDKGEEYQDHQWNEDVQAYVKKGVSGDDAKKVENQLTDSQTGRAVHRHGELEHGGKVYRRRNDVDKAFYETDQAGKFVGSDGKAITAEDAASGDSNNLNVARGAFGFKMKAMGEVGKDFWSSYAGSRNKSWSAKDAAEDEKIDKLQKNYGRMSADELNRLITIETDNTKKMAIAMTLAIKDGFKNKEQVQKAKQTLGDNQALQKKFNDSVDKKYAHLNYDMGTVDGRAKFNRRREEGKFDVLDRSAYENGNVVQALQEGLTPKEYNDHMAKVGRYSSSHARALERGLGQNIETQKDVVDQFTPTQFTAPRRAMMAATGNIAKSFKAVDLNNANQSAQAHIALNNLFGQLTARQIASLDADNFDEEKVATQFGGDKAQAQKFIGMLKLAIAKNVDSNKMENIKRNGGDTPGKVLAELDKIVSDRNNVISQQSQNTWNRSNGAGLDQDVISIVEAWKTRDGKNYFDDDAKVAQAIQDIEKARNPKP